MYEGLTIKVRQIKNTDTIPSIYTDYPQKMSTRQKIMFLFYNFPQIRYLWTKVPPINLCQDLSRLIVLLFSDLNYFQIFGTKLRVYHRTCGGQLL